MDAVLSATVVIIRVSIWSSCDSDSRSGDCIKSGKFNEAWYNVSSAANATRQAYVLSHVQILQAFYTPSIASITPGQGGEGER